MKGTSLRQKDFFFSGGWAWAVLASLPLPPAAGSAPSASCAASPRARRSGGGSDGSSSGGSSGGGPSRAAAAEVLGRPLNIPKRRPSRLGFSSSMGPGPHL